MKKALKVILSLLAIIVIGVVGMAIYVKKALPNLGQAEDITIESTPERIERGKYLANSVSVCMDCHSTRDFSLYAGPPTPGAMGAGGDIFGKELGLPGTIHIPNITPYALGNWTDGEIFRAITTGVSRDGHALFPIMPYQSYGQMDREDIYSIITYIRSLPPVKKDIPATELDFPVSILVNTMPQKASFTTKPDIKDEVQYGKYLITSANCVDCHSQNEKGMLVPGTEFGGGRDFALPGGIVRSANITKDATGIAKYSHEQFIALFKQYADSTYKPAKVGPNDFNTPMPWEMYAKMTEQDLGAIYAYLNTVKPIKNQVIKFEKK